MNLCLYYFTDKLRSHRPSKFHNDVAGAVCGAALCAALSLASVIGSFKAATHIDELVGNYCSWKLVQLFFRLVTWVRN